MSTVVARLDSPPWRRGVAWGVTTLAAWLLFWPFAPDEGSREIRGGDKAAHVVVFGGVAWAWGRVLEMRGGRVWRWRWGLAVGLAAATAGVELLQPLTGRSCDAVDAVAGCAGVAIATAMGAAPGVWIPAALTVGGGAFMAGGLRDYVREARAFPVLAAGEGEWWAEAWEANGVAVKRVEEGVRVEANGEEASWPGVFRVPAVRNWSKGGDWTIRVFWGGDGGAELVVRLDDDRKDNKGYGDRFQREWRVEPGWNEISIPRREWEKTSGGGPMDVRHIARWGIFLAENGDFVYWIVGGAELQQQEAAK